MEPSLVVEMAYYAPILIAVLTMGQTSAEVAAVVHIVWAHQLTVMVIAGTSLSFVAYAGRWTESAYIVEG